MKKAFNIVLFVIFVVCLSVLTSTIIYGGKENCSEWKECYSVAIFYTDNKYSEYETSETRNDYKYKKIYIKKEKDKYILKIIDWDNNKKTFEVNRKNQQILAEYC